MMTGKIIQEREIGWAESVLNYKLWEWQENDIERSEVNKKLLN